MYTQKTGKSFDRTMTKNIIDQDKRQEDQRPNNNYDYYIANGAGRVPLASAEQYEKIREAYVDNIGQLTGAVAKMIEEALATEMMKPEDVVDAIELTGLAPRPSAFYLRAILEDWEFNGVHHSLSWKKEDAGSWWK